MKRFGAAMFATGVVAGGLLLGGAFGCGEPSHVFTAVAYDEARDCVQPSGEAIDIVTGPDPGLGCALLCFVGRGPLTVAADGASPVFLSTMCPPYPITYTTDGTDPRCKKALDAREAGRRCLEDGGVTPTDAAPAETGAADTGAPETGPSDAGSD